MRILMLGTSFPRHRGSGIGRFVFELARALSAEHRVDVLTANFPHGEKYETMDGVEVHRFHYFLPSAMERLTYPGGLPDQLKVSWLARLQLPLFLVCYLIQCAIYMRKADAVVCNWIYTGTIMQLAMRLSFTTRCCVTVVRGSDMRLIEGGGLIAKIFLWTLKKCDAVCVVARDFVEELKEYGIDNVHFTPNGIHRQQFAVEQDAARQELSLGSESIVLYLGSLIDRKDVATLVAAMEGIDARLVVAGDGEQRECLERQASKNNINALFLGNIPVEKVPFWLAAADIFVLPSLYEGRPNALIEAMVAGKACIATDIQGTRELIEHGVSGYLFPPKDSEKLHQHLTELVSNFAKVKRFGVMARRKVQQEVPTWETCAENYQQVLTECCDSSMNM